MKSIVYLAFVLGVVLTACTNQNGPEPIRYNRDQCHYCKMSISEPAFGAELITPKGRVQKYDALECMVQHLGETDQAYRNLYAVPYDAPKTLVDVNELTFVISPDFRSPMAANLAAFSDTTGLEKYEHLKWEELLDELQ